MKKLFFTLSLTGILGAASLYTVSALTHVINAVPAEAVYQCPMKCEGDKTYKETGKCPKCGMNLSEVKKSPASESKSCTDKEKGGTKKCCSSGAHGKKSSCHDEKPASPAGTEKKKESEIK